MTAKCNHVGDYYYWSVTDYIIIMITVYRLLNTDVFQYLIEPLTWRIKAVLTELEAFFLLLKEKREMFTMFGWFSSLTLGDWSSSTLWKKETERSACD